MYTSGLLQKYFIRYFMRPLVLVIYAIKGVNYGQSNNEGELTYCMLTYLVFDQFSQKTYKTGS